MNTFNNYPEGSYTEQSQHFENIIMSAGTEDSRISAFSK